VKDGFLSSDGGPAMAGVRKDRPFADGVANGEFRPEGDLPAWPYERAVSSRNRSSAVEIRKCLSPSRMRRASYCRVWYEKLDH
jgi:hypothetical protein